MVWWPSPVWTSNWVCNPWFDSTHELLHILTMAHWLGASWVNQHDHKHVPRTYGLSGIDFEYPLWNMSQSIPDGFVWMCPENPNIETRNLSCKGFQSMGVPLNHQLLKKDVAWNFKPSRIQRGPTSMESHIYFCLRLLYSRPWLSDQKRGNLSVNFIQFRFV